MKRQNTTLGLLAAMFFLIQPVVAQKPAMPNPIARALEEEVKRAVDVFKLKANPAPYFIKYEVNDMQTVEVNASLGALRVSDKHHARYLDIDVRVGDYQYDNTHQIRGQRGGGFGGGNFNYPVSMPLD